jgi:hypothetical protein
MEGEIKNTVRDDDIYSDVDSDGFVQDMRAYGIGQALPLDVRAPCHCHKASGW